MNIKIKKHLLLYKYYKLKCSIGKSGIISSKKEGDLATPKGTFELGTLYYRRDKNKPIKCKIKKIIIKKKMGWCNDIKSKKYNQEISFPFRYRALYSEGSFAAAKWLMSKKPGLYSMRNVLNFK